MGAPSGGGLDRCPRWAYLGNRPSHSPSCRDVSNRPIKIHEAYLVVNQHQVRRLTGGIDTLVGQWTETQGCTVLTNRKQMSVQEEGPPTS